MLSKIKSPITAGVLMALLAVALSAQPATAGPSNRKTVIIVHSHPPPSPYAPYYYSPWSPYSLYSIYDHLSGGRELCFLPTEPCDNNHRVQN
jgi:hypothetical protein